MTSGKSVRVGRITANGKMLCIPMDHSITDGPVPGLEVPELMVKAVARGGATAFLAHKGILKSLQVPPSIGIILHLSASTSLGPTPNRKILVATVEEGIKLGADAISVHLNIGSKEEPEMLEQLGRVAEQCDTWQVPLIAMMYPRGEGIKKPLEPEVVAHVARIGAEAGADIVKTVYTGSEETFREVVRKCPVPMVLAGGAKVNTDRDLLELAESVMKAGAMGITFGRNVFGHKNPTAIVKALRVVVVDGGTASDAEEVLKGAL